MGATAYSTGKAKTISGITADDATGKITIHLTAPYGPFDNVLAFPALGLVPSSTPLTVQPNNPPPGVGPYKVTNIVPNQSFDVVKNPDWTPIPGIPSGHVNVNVKVSPNVSVQRAGGAQQHRRRVRLGRHDPRQPAAADQLARPPDRFANVNLGGSTYYVFLNVTKPPFSSQLAREAVVTGLDQNAMNRLGSGTLRAGLLLPAAGRPGPPDGRSCPYGDPGSGGNIAKAKQLVQQSGMAGTPVTVWSETRSPRQQWMTYYTQFLNQIGFKATHEGDRRRDLLHDDRQPRSCNPQTGFADWNQDFPNPVDFYLLLDGNAIQPTNNENFGQINDPKINAAIDEARHGADDAS